jgi:hypothetical protein
MADRNIPMDEASAATGDTLPMPLLKLKELPDGTYAIAMADETATAYLLTTTTLLQTLVSLIDGGALKVKLV